MALYQFKTNINCGNCLAKVSPYLDGKKEIENWEVDLKDDDRILTVETELDADTVVQTVKDAGYRAEVIGG